MEDGNNLSENNKVLEAILCALDESQNSAPSFIRKMLSTANMISKQDDVDFIFDTCEAHPLCGIVNNVHIGMKKLGEVVKNLHQQIDLDMSNILYGSPFPPKFSSNIAALEDVIQEKNPGFSFLPYGPNKIRSEKYALWLFKQITEVQTTGKSDFSAPEKAAKFEVVQAFGKNIRRGAVQRWLTKAQNIQEKLLACMHLSSGSPGRATELETLQLFNSEYNLRNFYVCQGRSLIVTRYSKVRSIAGWDRIIPRFPDPGTSKRFLSYLLLFRTLESVFVRSLYGVSAMKSHMQGVFVERGTSYVACRIRDEIRKIFHAHGIPIEFNQFRHFVTGMVPVIVKGCSEVLKEQFIEDASSIAHLQAGHSVEVAEHVYARKPSDIPTLPTTAVAKYRMFSTEWHKSMRLVESVQADKLLSPSALSKENVRSISNIITSISSRVSDNLREALSDTNGSDLKKKRIEHPTQPSQLSRRQFRQFLRDPPARNFEQLLTKYLPTLRSFFKSDKVMFRSAMQLDVTVSVCEAREDLMVLMPTGSGKSMTVLLPAFLEGNNYCTVVIVPLAALVQEYVEKCRRHGISFATWSNREHPAQVYIISTDHNFNELQSFLRQLRNKGVLRRLVIDEVHLLMAWLSFRPSFRRLPHALKSGGRYIQVVLFTATLPPFQRERLLSLLGVPSITLYQQPTVRKNLKFSVVDTSETRCDGRFSSLQETMTRALCEEVKNSCRQNLVGGKGRIMVFTLYQREVERLQNAIQEHMQKELNYHFPVYGYHGGMSLERQTRSFLWWKADDMPLKIIVCTSAFGTGVDVANVRGVFHYGGCNGILEYVQEAGRAGRDMLPAVCVIVHHRQYLALHGKRVYSTKKNMSLNDSEEDEEKREEWEQMVGYITGNKVCRKNELFSYLDGKSPGLCVFDPQSWNCDVCDIFGLGTRLTVVSNGEQIENRNEETKLHVNRNNGSLKNESSSKTAGESKIMAREVEVGNTRGNISSESRAKDQGKLLDNFRAKAHWLSSLCIACYVIQDKHENKNHNCRWMAIRCRRCFRTKHKVTECDTFNPRRKNYCYGCSLSQIEGENIHRAGEFGRICFLGATRDLAWMMWEYSEEMRSEIVENLFNSVEKRKYLDLEENQTGKSRENKEGETSNFFAKWLPTEWNGVPNQAKLTLWKCQKDQ